MCKRILVSKEDGRYLEFWALRSLYIKCKGYWITRRLGKNIIVGINNQDNVAFFISYIYNEKKIIMVICHFEFNMKVFYYFFFSLKPSLFLSLVQSFSSPLMHFFSLSLKDDQSLTFIYEFMIALKILIFYKFTKKKLYFSLI
jgi:hypothetical protein